MSIDPLAEEVTIWIGSNQVAAYVMISGRLSGTDDDDCADEVRPLSVFKPMVL